MTEEISKYRIGKNSEENFEQLTVHSDGDSDLIKSVYLYLSFIYQRDIFNFGTFDVKDFCRVFGYNYKNLQKTNSEALQLKRMNRDVSEKKRLTTTVKDGPKEYALDDYLWISHIENALYTLNAENIMEDYYEESDGNRIKRSKSIHVIRDLSAIVKNGNKEVEYKVELSDEFLSQMSLKYVPINKNILVSARKKNLEDVYIIMERLKLFLYSRGQWQTTPDNTLNFEYLCRLARIPLKTADGNLYENKFRKAKLAIKLNELIKIYKENSDPMMNEGFKFEWVAAPGERAAYTAIFSFNPNGADKATFERVGRFERANIFAENIKRELAKAFTNATKVPLQEDTEEFYFWLYNCNREDDISNKRFAYEKASEKTFGSIPTNLEKKLAEFFQFLEDNKNKHFDKLNFRQLFPW